MTHNFQNVAIKCQTWQQMLHLADLARAQGNETDLILFCEEDFNKGMTYFLAENKKYGNVADCTVKNYTQIPYTTFINPPSDESVYGC